jgi:hypothetical protein
MANPLERALHVDSGSFRHFTSAADIIKLLGVEKLTDLLLNQAVPRPARRNLAGNQVSKAHTGTIGKLGSSLHEERATSTKETAANIQ